MEKPVQYEVLLRNNKYLLQVYSNFGCPLRNILFQAEYNTKEEAELNGVRFLKNKYKDITYIANIGNIIQ